MTLQQLDIKLNNKFLFNKWDSTGPSFTALNFMFLFYLSLQRQQLIAYVKAATQSSKEY